MGHDRQRLEEVGGQRLLLLYVSSVVLEEVAKEQHSKFIDGGCLGLHSKAQEVGSYLYQLFIVLLALSLAYVLDF